jgi:hypothetical protein
MPQQKRRSENGAAKTAQRQRRSENGAATTTQQQRHGDNVTLNQGFPKALPNFNGTGMITALPFKQSANSPLLSGRHANRVSCLMYTE